MVRISFTGLKDCAWHKPPSLNAGDCRASEKDWLALAQPAHLSSTRLLLAAVRTARTQALKQGTQKPGLAASVRCAEGRSRAEGTV